MTRYVGALDQGTTSTRFILFDHAANICALAQREHHQIYPAPGYVEHDASAIWKNSRAVIASTLRKAKAKPHDLAAIGITNQRETTLLWDRKSGLPLHNALVWQDTRTAQRVAELTREGGQDRIRDQTGLPLATYFSALKLAWLLDHLPGARAKAERSEVLFGTIDSWLAWNLSGGIKGGVHITDVTNASRTQLMNLHTLEWDEDLLRLFHIPHACLPRICSSSEIYAHAVAPLKGVPIAGILGDQQAALFGQACLAPGEVKNTYGTGCFLLMNTGEQPCPSRHGLLTTLAYKLGSAPAIYALEGSVAIAGALVQWLRDNLTLITSSPAIEHLAASVPDNGDVYIVPAFSGLYAPHWQESARGTICGLTRFAHAGHIARASLEATAFQSCDVIAAMEKDSNIVLNSLKVDGGMVANALLMQFQADLLNVPVTRPKIIETTALGAAYAAGLAVGFWRSTEEVKANWLVDQVFTPSMKAVQRAHLQARWQKALTRAFDWAEA